MKIGRLSENVSFEDKERDVRLTLADWKLRELDLLENRDHEEYVRFIEERYEVHRQLEMRWQEYIEGSASPEQLERLNGYKGTPKYSAKLLELYLALNNR